MGAHNVVGIQCLGFGSSSPSGFNGLNVNHLHGWKDGAVLNFLDAVVGTSAVLAVFSL